MDGIFRKQSEGVEKGDRKERKVSKGCVHNCEKGVFLLWATKGEGQFTAVSSRACVTHLSELSYRAKDIGVFFFSCPSLIEVHS